MAAEEVTARDWAVKPFNARRSKSYAPAESLWWLLASAIPYCRIL